MTEQSLLARIREGVAGIVAVLMVTGFIGLVIRASGASETDFERYKELIGIVNTLVGVVVGYYFSRMQGEARAEHAESAVESATMASQAAQQGRLEAERKSSVLTDTAANVTAALDRLRRAATPGAQGELPPAEAAGVRARLQAALEDAESSLATARRVLAA